MRLEKPLAPGATIGILGGGQLGRMLALAAGELASTAISCAEAAAAFQVSGAHTVAGVPRLRGVEAFASKVDVVTYEFENVPSDTRVSESQACLAKLGGVRGAGRLMKRPSSRASVFRGNLRGGECEADLHTPLPDGRPEGVKTRRFGYDGKGQTRIAPDTSTGVAWAEIGKAPAILEGFISFSKEISVIAARGWGGVIAVYDVPENHHENHILKTSTVPAGISRAMAEEAREVARTIIGALDYVGVMGIEMFVAGTKLIVNEIAPRVHNSGHWTQDACVVSQFEQHIRAICGWPLGSTERHSNVVMHNILGGESANWADYGASAHTGVHFYGKAERPRDAKWAI